MFMFCKYYIICYFSYIPRIFFLTSDGQVRNEIKNEKTGSEKYKYFYSNADAIVHSMKKVLEGHGHAKEDL